MQIINNMYTVKRESELLHADCVLLRFFCGVPCQQSVIDSLHYPLQWSELKTNGSKVSRRS